MIFQNNASMGGIRHEYVVASNDFTAIVKTNFSAGYVYEIMCIAYRPTDPAYRLQIVQAVTWLNGEEPTISTLKDDMVTHSGNDVDITLSLATDGKTLNANVKNCNDGDMTLVFAPILKIPNRRG